MVYFEKWLTKCEEVLVTVAAIVMVLLVFIQVVCRYVLEVSLQGTEELARYLMITGTFLGAAVAVKRKGHIQVDLRHLFGLNAKTREIWDTVVNFVAMSVLCLMAYYVYHTLPSWSDRSTALGIPMIFPVGAVFIGLVLMIIHYILLIFQSFTKQKNEK